MSIDHLMRRLTDCTDRFEAAVIIRAIGAENAAGLYCCSDASRLQVVADACATAAMLERDYCVSDVDDTPIAESEHPWRDWLEQRGYPRPGNRAVEED